MKNLLIFVLLIASVGLYFHDKQQTTDLAKTQADLDTAQTQNSDLTQKVGALQTQVNNLQAQVRQAAAAATVFQPQPQRPAQQAPPSGGSSLGGASSLQGSSLDRGAYK